MSPRHEKPESAPSMARLQELDYGEGRDYTIGSPHLQHTHLKEKIERDLTSLVIRMRAKHGQCRAVEIGAGHGTFTSALVSAGASVTVSEMSEPSVRVLEARFRHTQTVRIVHDADGGQAERAIADGCELVVFIGVLHHIPDYLEVTEKLVALVVPDGAFYCAMDPLWYDRMKPLHLRAHRAAYMVWRLGQGNIWRGIRTRVRRLRGIYHAAEPSDMIEYHVVRDGVDEQALEKMLSSQFDEVTLWAFWATQAPRLQRLGERMGWRSTFGFSATGRR